MIEGRARTAYQAGFDVVWTTSDWLWMSVPAAGLAVWASRSSDTFRVPGPRIVTGTDSLTRTFRGRTGIRASSPSAALPAEPVAR